MKIKTKSKNKCIFCSHRRVKKDFIQQNNCELENNPKKCTEFIDMEELKKYKEMLGE